VNRSDAASPAAQSGASLNPSDLLSQLLSQYTNFYGNMFQELATFFQDPIGNSVKIVQAFMTNPSEALVLYGPLLFAIAYQAFSWVGAGITYPSLLLSPFLGLVLPVALQPALAFVAAGAPALAAPVAGAVAATAVPVSAVWPVAGVAPTTVAAPAGAPASAPAASVASAAPAPAATAGTFAYMVGFGGGPGTESGPTVGPRGGIKAPAATVPAAAAAVPSRAEARARRRRRAAMREYGDEFLDMDSDIGVAPEYELASAVASGSGAGRLGLAGTAPKDAAVGVAGLTKLAGDEFGGGPRVPMVPGTWDHEPERGGDDGT
jgi:PPE-repeat protein